MEAAEKEKNRKKGKLLKPKSKDTNEEVVRELRKVSEETKEADLDPSTCLMQLVGIGTRPSFTNLTV